ncbi:anti-phage defense-associated sirtuin Dsr1 [Mesorhizobium neociceri]|uniref:SIR2 family protein n=1 Tax=Mesorhizobium neociceri TaxID=1307853 RepID=A0A838B912_9HYPH|nr:anti-phage defense-associated sirtuin Dsr1 [Mesorhizobium neociceri]MBA1143086.1 SIR2 family protein [Mesorhizobium neociceri]
MQFIKNGPDVPEPLLQAHEDGRVVFFCGAGISYPARLPGFQGLVEKIYDDLGEVPNAVERIALESGQYDTTIGLLENRVVDGRSAVRRALERVLAPDLTLPSATKTHEALLTLAKNRAGQSRLITTNFDSLFTAAMSRLGITLGDFAAPLLPVPKKRWDGVVYLHGRLPENPTQSDLDRLVISSGDFGLAYLTERWAARFVSELFRNHTVCFVGYSINDPVMRYMMDALAADRLLGEAPISVFAFGNHIRGREAEAEAEWVAKNVTPILYRNHNHHALLHRTLHAWAETYRDGVRGKEAIVSRYATLRPMGSTRQDNFVGRMLWALCDESGLPAKALADHNPLPSIEWLHALAEDRFGHRDLARFGIAADDAEDKKLAYSLIARPASYTRSPWMRLVHRTDRVFSRWDKVMPYIARWLARHLDNPELLLWVVNQGGSVDDHFRFFLENELGQRPPSPAMEALWRIVLSGRVSDSSRHFDLYSWIKRLKRSGLTALLRMQLREILSPRVQIRPSYRMSEEAEGDAGVAATSRRPDQLVEWELVLAADYVHSALRDIGKSPEWQAALPVLLNDATELLLDAMDIMRELQAADEISDRSYWQQPSISDHPQNRKYRDWTALIELARDAWLAAAYSSPPRAVREVHRWLELPYPVFRRLALFAIAERRDLFPSSEAVDQLLSDNAWWLWSIETHREAMRLLVALAPSLPALDTERLQRAIMLGPPARMFAEGREPETLRRVFDREIWVRLTAMREAGGDLILEATALLEDLARTYPQWTPADEKAEFPVWMGSGGSWRTHSATPSTVKELVVWLRENGEVDDFDREDDWRERCRKDFKRTAAALLHLARRGEWLTRRWRQALQAWSEAELSERSWRCAAIPLAGAPDAVIEEIDHAIAWWLKAAAKSIGEQREPFFTLVRRIMNIRREEEIEDGNDAITVAINHPVGMTTEAVLDYWYAGGLEDNQGLVGEVAEILTRLCDESVPAFRHGSILLGTNTITLFRVDRAWTTRFLLPQFDWHRSAQTALLAWTGYLWSPRFYRPLLEAIKDQFLETARHYNVLAQIAEQYAALLTVVALDEGGIFTNVDLRTATAALPEEGLVRAAQTLVDGLQGAADRRVEYWQNRVKPYLGSIWPKSHDIRTPQVSEKLAQLVIAAGGAFPDALRTLRGWLLPVQHSDYILNLLSESGHCGTFPQDALAFLDFIVPVEQMWVANELRKCLIAIRTAWPQAVQDQRFARLETIVRQTGQGLE